MGLRSPGEADIHSAYTVYAIEPPKKGCSLLGFTAVIDVSCFQQLARVMDGDIAYEVEI